MSLRVPRAAEGGCRSRLTARLRVGLGTPSPLESRGGGRRKSQPPPCPPRPSSWSPAHTTLASAGLLGAWEASWWTSLLGSTGRNATRMRCLCRDRIVAGRADPAGAPASSAPTAAPIAPAWPGSRSLTVLTGLSCHFVKVLSRGTFPDCWPRGCSYPPGRGSRDGGPGGLGPRLQLTLGRPRVRKATWHSAIKIWGEFFTPACPCDRRSLQGGPEPHRGLTPGRPWC